METRQPTPDEKAAAAFFRNVRRLLEFDDLEAKVQRLERELARERMFHQEPRRPRLQQDGRRALENLRWRLVEMGERVDEFDRAAIEKIEYLLAMYGR